MHIDTLGLGGIALVLLLFGIPYLRFIARTRSIPGWPTAIAKVTAAGAGHGVPVFWSRFSDRLSHCAVSYQFEVLGAIYNGWFALMASDEQTATRMAEALSEMTITIRYNPKKPTDSVTAERVILGAKVLQEGNWLNPKVW
jgi:hypothetical protein